MMYGKNGRPCKKLTLIEALKVRLVGLLGRRVG